MLNGDIKYLGSGFDPCGRVFEYKGEIYREIIDKNKKYVLNKEQLHKMSVEKTRRMMR